MSKPSLKSFWQGLQASEKRAVGLLVFVLLAAGLYMFAWQPASKAHAQLVRNLKQQMADYEFLLSKVETIRQLQRAVSSTKGQALTLAAVDKSLKNLKPYLVKLQPKGSDYDLVLRDVPLKQWLTWLYGLNQAWSIKRLKMQPQAPGHAAQGRVDVQMTLTAL